MSWVSLTFTKACDDFWAVVSHPKVCYKGGAQKPILNVNYGPLISGRKYMGFTGALFHPT